MKNEEDYVTCDVHFRDEKKSNEFAVKIKANYIDSPKTLTGYVLIGYTHNKSQLRFISADVILWKNDQKVELKTSLNDYNIKLKVRSLSFSNYKL